jgi:hypothetical protein
VHGLPSSCVGAARKRPRDDVRMAPSRTASAFLAALCTPAALAGPSHTWSGLTIKPCQAAGAVTDAQVRVEHKCLWIPLNHVT